MGLTTEIAPDDGLSDLVALYSGALRELSLQNGWFASNRIRYLQWDFEQRLRWIYRMQTEAEKGLPLAVALVTTATTIRLTT